MSSRSGSRPSLRRDDSSSSLEGMERPTRARRPRDRSPRIESIINLYVDKPLPPTPGRPTPSPLSFVSNITPSSASTRSVQSEATGSSRFLKKISSKQSGKSKIPEQLQIRPRLRKGEKFQSEGGYASHGGFGHPITIERSLGSLSMYEEMHPGERVQTPPASKEPIFTEWKAPKYRPAVKKAESVPPTMLKSKIERRWAENYMALTDDVSPQSPEARASLADDSTYEPSPVTPPIPDWADAEPLDSMEARISNVLDQPLIPDLESLEQEHRSSWTPGSEAEPIFSEERDMIDPNWQPKRHADIQAPRRRPSSKYPEVGLRPDSVVDMDSELQKPTRTRKKSIRRGVTDAVDSIHQIANLNPFKHNAVQSGSPERCQGSTYQPAGPEQCLGEPEADRVKDSLAGKGQHNCHAKPGGRQPSLELTKPRRIMSDSQGQKHGKSMGKKLLSALEKGKLKRSQQQECRQGLKRQIVHVIPERPIEGEKF